jgi:putative ABC transport system ATP-binding protein
MSDDIESGALISLHGVSKAYTTGAVDFTALDRIDPILGAVEFVGMVGPSGSGKSTLLNLVTAIDRPSDGHVVVGDVEVSAPSENEAAKWRGRNLRVIFQFFQLLPTLSPADSVMFPMSCAGPTTARSRPDVARELLARVGLADHADKLPSQVSGGQQQRAAIAQALANDPPIIVGDEPTGNLDSAAAAPMMARFDTLVASGRTVVLVTHTHDQQPPRCWAGGGIQVGSFVVVVAGAYLLLALRRALPDRAAEPAGRAQVRGASGPVHGRTPRPSRRAGRGVRGRRVPRGPIRRRAAGGASAGCRRRRGSRSWRARASARTAHRSRPRR